MGLRARISGSFTWQEWHEKEAGSHDYWCRQASWIGLWKKVWVVWNLGKLACLLRCVNLWVKIWNLRLKFAKTERGNARGERNKMAAVFTHFLTQKYTGLPNKVCPRLRDSACWCSGEITQPRTSLIREPCTPLSIPSTLCPNFPPPRPSIGRRSFKGFRFPCWKMQ